QLHAAGQLATVAHVPDLVLHPYVNGHFALQVHADGASLIAFHESSSRWDRYPWRVSSLGSAWRSVQRALEPHVDVAAAGFDDATHLPALQAEFAHAFIGGLDLGILHLHAQVFPARSLCI